MNIGSQHQHARKRIFQHLEPFPSRHLAKRMLDYLMFGVGILQPFALAPQIYSIYVYHETAGVSIATWFLLGCCNILWTLYGIVHRERPIIILNVLSTILDFVIVYGIIR